MDEYVLKKTIKLSKGMLARDLYKDGFNGDLVLAVLEGVAEDAGWMGSDEIVMGVGGEDVRVFRMEDMSPYWSPGNLKGGGDGLGSCTVIVEKKDGVEFAGGMTVGLRGA